MATFVAELALKTTEKDDCYFWKISDSARQLQNACIGEALNRLDQIKRTNLYKRTIRLPQGNKKRTRNFKHLNEKFGFNKNDIEKFAKDARNDSKFINKLVGSQVAQKISNRAFESVQKFAFKRSKKVHFKPKGEFISLEGKNNRTFLRYSNGYALIGKRTFKCIINPKDVWMQHALKQRIKYCRLIRKIVKGKDKFYLQLILEGTPYQKYEIGKGVSGLDLGPSTIAIVNDKFARLKEFCEELIFLDKEKRRLQRLQDRRRRFANPNNYNANGTIKKGRKTWVNSNRYKNTQIELSETERKLQETRKHLHGREVNKILKNSNIVKTEKLSYKAFQKLFGKSVGRRAPGAFIAALKRKLAYQGGKLIEFSTYTTKLSQTCHCGKVEKKRLSDRWHECECGVKSQRDLYSAFLAKHVNEDEVLNFKKANKSWNGTKKLLDKTIMDLKSNKKTRKLNASFGI